MNKRVAVYAGSFDPPTSGHAWMIYEGAKLFDKLIVAVGKNPDKRTDPEVIKVNSITFRISNHGKFDSKLSFSLMSLSSVANPRIDLFTLSL